ncbi:MAG: sulfate reduction electron transfer complex DsrMKJOP subunit DsrJ [Elusimicrobiota bacterium]
MHDTGKILAGLLVFLALVSFPFWYNAASGKGAYKPEPKLPVGEKRCVAPREYMKSFHMDLLNTWRDEVVREGKREYVAHDGKKYDKSLSRTCMSCHTSRKDFCLRCHEYAGVTPYCWDCHVEPKDTE